MEPDAGMLLQELPHQRGLVSREIVEDDVDLLIGRAQGHDFLQEDDKVVAGVACSSLSVNAAGRCIQRRIQRQGSVPVVFKSVALGAARRKRKHRIEAIQRLNGSLLIDTEHGGMVSGGSNVYSATGH